jgi:hypothetical protein
VFYCPSTVVLVFLVAFLARTLAFCILCYDFLKYHFLDVQFSRNFLEISHEANSDASTILLSPHSEDYSTLPSLGGHRALFPTSLATSVFSEEAKLPGTPQIQRCVATEARLKTPRSIRILNLRICAATEASQICVATEARLKTPRSTRI